MKKKTHRHTPHFWVLGLPPKEDRCSNAVYYVKNGNKVDIFVTDSWSNAFPANVSEGGFQKDNLRVTEIILSTKSIDLEAEQTVLQLIAQEINKLTTFTVEDSELPIFHIVIEDIDYVVTFKNKITKGTYGIGGISIEDADLQILSRAHLQNITEKVHTVSLGDIGATDFNDNIPQKIKDYAIAEGIEKLPNQVHKWEILGNPFYLDSNGVTIKAYSGVTAGTMGKADGDTSGKVYTAVDNDTIRDLDPETDDYTVICTTLVTDMRLMFKNTSFNQNIESWDVSNVTDMAQMFRDTPFNQDIGSWDVSSVTTMRRMFSLTSSFNQDIESWNVSNVTNMSGMFQGADVFNQPLNYWDVSNATDMSSMFKNANSFNQPLNNWVTSNVTNMRNMFDSAFAFQQEVNTFDMSNVTNTRAMFAEIDWNFPLDTWDMRKVEDISKMFQRNKTFNQNIGMWQFEVLDQARELFDGATSYNNGGSADINNWNVSTVRGFYSMFFKASSFNQPLSNWDVTGCDNSQEFFNSMFTMFKNATVFNQDLTNWCVENISTEPSGFADLSALTTANKPNWGVACP